MKSVRRLLLAVIATGALGGAFACSSGNPGGAPGGGGAAGTAGTSGSLAGSGAAALSAGAPSGAGTSGAGTSGAASLPGGAAGAGVAGTDTGSGGSGGSAGSGTAGSTAAGGGAGACSANCPPTSVITYPTLPGATPSTLYTLTVNGNPVFVEQLSKFSQPQPDNHQDQQHAHVQQRSQLLDPAGRQ